MKVVAALVMMVGLEGCVTDSAAVYTGDRGFDGKLLVGTTTLHVQVGSAHEPRDAEVVVE